MTADFLIRTEPSQLSIRRLVAIALLLIASGPAVCQEANEVEHRVHGTVQPWHCVTIDLTGPQASEEDSTVNPFVDLEMWVRFTHTDSGLTYRVPGYFAADGSAAESGATEGRCWRAHLTPDAAGTWQYEIEFYEGGTVVNGRVEERKTLAPFHGVTGRFVVGASEEVADVGTLSRRDLRQHGRLRVSDKGYLQHAGSKRYFLKAGPDAPETLLAYRDFDATTAGKPKQVPLKSWQPHVQDWRPGDPTWQDGKGKGLIGAINYLAEKGVNSLSFLPYNAGGDGDNVWPMVRRDDKLRYDCSKLDQWQIVMDHATDRGMHLHFKLQENEIDDDRVGAERRSQRVPEALDGGRLGVERRLYLRELVARFGHALAVTWNLGEENTQSPDELQSMIAYLHEVDPYDHLVVVHTFPQQQDEVYEALLPPKSDLTGVSLQNPWNAAHRRTLHWIERSTAAGRRWVVCQDEQNPASHGVPPDPGYAGQDGIAARDSQRPYDLHDIRKQTLWGTLMAGGAGVEYYFGYQMPQNDLNCEDFRSRDRSWDYCRIALDFFEEQSIPIETMQSMDQRVRSTSVADAPFCFGADRGPWLVYLPSGGQAELDLKDAAGSYSLRWFNPRSGGPLATGSIERVEAPAVIQFGPPPADPNQDWLVLIQPTDQ